MENDRLLADGSFSSQDYVSATNIEEPKGSEMSARSVVEMIGCCRRIISARLCECKNSGTERFRDEREERKKNAGLGGK
ncbi:MAG: hypothetical protein V8Q92_04360 [Coprococcus comes]